MIEIRILYNASLDHAAPLRSSWVSHPAAMVTSHPAAMPPGGNGHVSQPKPGSSQRSVVIAPGPTSPGHGLVHGPVLGLVYGPVLDYGYPPRPDSGTMACSWIGSYNLYGNPRLIDGDQYNAILIAERQNSARYSLNTVMKYATDTRKGGIKCATLKVISLPHGSALENIATWCHVGSERESYFKETSGTFWCPPGSTSTGSIPYSVGIPDGLFPIRPASPFRFVKSRAHLCFT
jgi:hypothetical protein